MYLEEPSGFIYIDIDNNNHDINFLKQDEYIYSCWRSLSDTGVGALVKVNGITAQNFKECWRYLENYFRGYGITIDQQTNDITRQNVISFDPDIYINENAALLLLIRLQPKHLPVFHNFKIPKNLPCPACIMVLRKQV